MPHACWLAMLVPAAEATSSLIRDAGVEAGCGEVEVLAIDDVPPVLLTTREVSQVTRLPVPVCAGRDPGGW